MHLVRIAILSLSWFALSCGLFPSSDNHSSGSNAPVMYPSNGGQAGIGSGGAGAVGRRPTPRR